MSARKRRAPADVPGINLEEIDGYGRPETFRELGTRFGELSRALGFDAAESAKMALVDFKGDDSFQLAEAELRSLRAGIAVAYKGAGDDEEADEEPRKGRVPDLRSGRVIAALRAFAAASSALADALEAK